jgi:hypothetical protein
MRGALVGGPGYGTRQFFPDFTQDFRPGLKAIPPLRGTIFRNPSTVPTQSEFTHMLLKGVSCPRDLAKSEKRPYCFGGGGVLFGC